MSETDVVFSEQVEHTLKSARFLHLATSFQDMPHVSLMNYVYVDKDSSAPHHDGPAIIIVSQKDTKKYENMSKNPNVSVLIHDWTTARNVTGSLEHMLQALNQSEMSSVSVTLSGTASELDGVARDYFLSTFAKGTPDETRKFITGDIAVVLIKIEEQRVSS